MIFGGPVLTGPVPVRGPVRGGGNSRAAAARWSEPGTYVPVPDMEAPGRWRRGMHQRPGF
ncbi:hypothetical protein SSOG_04489 [Streptomyces himastatinicus ATCC 53653]|uniref:Uncharacterized protein n=1 Tax=Streptomyces himastatinicus ATCC 53653 TaxID=457427 RepID=D9W8T7_9ACTN|nr:hypothetical protein SSOG_04489 [Streptomyces himastatinicus ATCC 53653]